MIVLSFFQDRLCSFAVRASLPPQRVPPPSGSFVHSSEKGTEYKLEFEDEYDSGTIAKLERLFFRPVRDLLVSIDWSSSDDRRISPLANPQILFVSESYSPSCSAPFRPIA